MVKVGSLNISPPLLNASCAWASDLNQLQALSDCPYTGAVVTRTAIIGGFAEDASHTVAFATSSTTSLNSYGYSPHRLSQYLSWIESILSLAKSTPISNPNSKPFIISITATQAGDMRVIVDAIQALRAKAPVYANIGVEFNTSCPNIRGSAPSGYALAELVPVLDVLVDAWCADNTLTIGLKLPPYVYGAQFAQVFETLRGLSTSRSAEDGSGIHPIAYIACTNTLGNALLFPEQVEGASVEGGMPFAVPTALGGVAGDTLHPLALGNVYSFARLLEAEDSTSALKNLVVIGIGGVTSAEAAERMRRAGASIVGSATLFGREGVHAFKILSDEV